MARGWESKAVEAQIEDAQTRAEGAQRPKLSAEEAARERQRESLELSRTRVLQDLASAKNPKYRELLTESLRFLEEKIQDLQDPAE
ncbi:MAG TPA: hypothetical protein VH351_22410 [Bryobacteraceae bacterium]|jgi:hypothetical protein|nr:hypothetical protein [Bryobacteraceae bacterium]